MGGGGGVFVFGQKNFFCSLRNILKLQCLVDNLIGVLELPMIISGSLP